MQRQNRVLIVLMLLGALGLIGLALGLHRGAGRAEPGASPSRGRRYTNHLIHETSPYLLLHAHNPVEWYPWGEEALRKARQEDKPIFLSVGYSTCHWCHVMEEQSFTDLEIAALMNEHFVNIKVDREERPDLDALYMAAVQLMTGRGGWPMSVWLTPDLEPFFGGTYFPPQQFTQILQQLAEDWRTQREEINQQAHRLAQAMDKAATPPGSTGAVSEKLVAQAMEGLERHFDPPYGGFGPAPKFPPDRSLALLLREYQRTGQESHQRMIRVTLDKMAQGGMYDQIGGGFHRYSTDAQWLVPHFEKMLYNQALLGPVYAEAWKITQDPYYRRIAEDTYRYVRREMTSPEGAFYSAQDADSPGGEGAFYVWRPEEIEAVLGAPDSELFQRIYGVTERGNFAHPGGLNEDHSVLHLTQPLPQWASDLQIPLKQLERRLGAMREKLYQARQKRPPPPLDDKIITGWNGLMIDALASSARILAEPQYIQQAEAAADFILENLYREGQLLRIWRRGRAQIPAFQDDYAFLIGGLLSLYGATAEKRWLEKAQALAETMIEKFWDEEQGGFFYTEADQPDLLHRGKNPYDQALPSGNSAAVQALLRLAAWTNREDYREKAERTLTALAPLAEKAPHGLANLLLAVDWYLHGVPGISSVPGLVADPSRGSLSGLTSAGRVTVETSLRPAGLEPGGKTTLTLRLRIAAGWHINSHRPPAEDFLPTTVTFLPPPGIQVTGVQYPPGETVRFEFSDQPLSVYAGTVVIQAQVTSTSQWDGRSPLAAQLQVQACEDQTCLLPAEIPLDIPLAPEN